MKIKARKICAAALLSFLFAACGNKSAPPSAEKSPPAQTASEIRVSQIGTDSAEPNIAAAPDGGAFVVWTQHGANKQADVFLQKFDANGAAVAQLARVNPNVGEATAWRGDPPTVKAGANGKIYVGWTTSVESNGKKGTNLMLSVSRDGGKTFAAPVKINDDAVPASHGMHSLAIDANDRVLMAWLDERNIKPEKAKIENEMPPVPTPESQIAKKHHPSNHNSNAQIEPSPPAAMKEESEPNSEVFYAVSADGGATFSANKKLAADVCPCCKTASLFAPDGTIFVSWRQVLAGDFRHIAVASSADGGATFSASVIVSDDQWQLNACPVSGASLVFADDQRLKILWFSGGKAGQPGLYFSESADGGKSFAPRRAVYENYLVGAPHLISDGARKIKVVFEANGKLFSRNLASENVEAKEFGAGDVPAAAMSGGKTFVAFVKKENNQRGVWLNISEN